MPTALATTRFDAAVLTKAELALAQHLGPLARVVVKRAAMKARDEKRVSTLRMVNAAIKNADIEARGQGKDPLDDGAVLGLLQKMIKQRQESVECDGLSASLGKVNR